MRITTKTLVGWLRVLIGGPLGLLAWAVSGASALAIVIWGLKTVAIPLLMLKTASWGIWGFGVMKESKTRVASGQRYSSQPSTDSANPSKTPET